MRLAAIEKAEEAREILSRRLAEYDERLGEPNPPPYIVRGASEARRQIEKLDALIARGKAEHLRDRAAKVALRAKQRAAGESGRIACEACQWSHPMPEALSVIRGRFTAESDDRSNLALLCPNCDATANTLRGRGAAFSNRDELIAHIKKLLLAVD